MYILERGYIGKKQKEVGRMMKDLADEGAGGWILFPDSNGFVAAARGKDGGNAAGTSGGIPSEAPNPIGVAEELLNLL